MDDVDSEMQKLWGVLIAAVIFVVSAYYSWTELSYALRSHVVEAQVTGVQTRQEIRHHRRGRRGIGTLVSAAGGGTHTTVYDVHLTYPDPNGAALQGTITSSDDPHLAAGQSVKVEYLAGSSGSLRHAYDRNYIAMGLFFGSLILLVGAIAWLAREANAPIANTRRSARFQKKREW